MRGLFTRSLLGGFYIGIAMLACLVVSGMSTDFGRLLGALVFPVGILLVIHANGALFTGVTGQFASREVVSRQGNTLTFHKEPLKKWGIDLGIALVGNILGIAFFAFLAQRQIGSIDARVATPPIVLFGFGVLCNVLVFISLNARKMILQYIPIFAFVLLGFAHSIADIALMFLSQQFHWFIIPVLLGNLVGGAGFSLIYELTRPKKS